MWSVRRDKNYCIFRTSCAIATKLKIKNHYIMKKIQNPKIAKYPFPQPISSTSGTTSLYPPSPSFLF